MRRYNLSDRVCIDQTAEENERHEMVVQDFRVEVEVDWNKGPGDKEWDKSHERKAGFVASGATSSDYIHRSARQYWLEGKDMRQRG